MHDYARLLSTIPAVCLGHRTHVAARELGRLYQRHFRGVPLTGSQFGILVTLAATPDRSIAALAREMGMEPTTMVRAVQELERRGLLRTAGGAGRQAKRSAVTAAGRRLLVRATPRWQAAHDAMVAALGGETAARSTLRAIGRLERAAVALLADAPAAVPKPRPAPRPGPRAGTRPRR